MPKDSPQTVGRMVNPDKAMNNHVSQDQVLADGERDAFGRKLAKPCTTHANSRSRDLTVQLIVQLLADCNNYNLTDWLAQFESGLKPVSFEQSEHS